MVRPITPEYARLLFSYNFETGDFLWRERPASHFSKPSQARRFNTRLAGKPAGNIGPLGYRRVNIENKFYSVHRLVWLMVYGEWPTNVDHINGDRADNRLVNLRSVTSLDNARNASRPKHNTSGIVGVSYCRRDDRWQAYIGTGSGKRQSLGYFVDRDGAIAARKAAESDLGYHPNHGRVNFVSKNLMCLFVPPRAF